MPEFLSQGKHFAAGLGKAVHPEQERSGLSAMYEHQLAGRTIEDFAKEVRPPVTCLLPVERLAAQKTPPSKPQLAFTRLTAAPRLAAGGR